MSTPKPEPVSEKEVRLVIYQCPRHKYMAVGVEPLSGNHGHRLTPSKCCGWWEVVKHWNVEAGETIRAIEEQARG